MILDKYLVLNKNEELFSEWLKKICQANSKQSKECFQCLSEWWNLSQSVTEPKVSMGDRPVTALDGIDEVLGRRLEAEGFHKVCFKSSSSLSHTIS